MYRTPIQDVQSLCARIMTGCETIRSTPGIFQRILDLIRRRIDPCINADGGYFEHLLCERVLCGMLLRASFQYFPSINVL